MTKFILRWAINAAAIYLAVTLVTGIHLEGDVTGVIWLALILGLLNAFIRPVLRFLTCPFIILTLGLFTFVINTFVFWLMGQIGKLVGIPITIDGLVPAFLGGLVVTLVSIVLSMILREELHGAPRPS